MKRMMALFSASILLLTAGCSKVSLPGKTPNCMTGSFTAQVTLTTSEGDAGAILTRYGTSAWNVCFTEPAALDGVELDFLDDEVKASYKGLEFSVPQSAQALRTEFAELMTAIDGYALQSELDTHSEDDLQVCEGELDVGSFTLALTSEGVPVRFSLPAYGLEIGFDSFDASEITTEAPTIPKTYPVTDAPTECLSEEPT